MDAGEIISIARMCGYCGFCEHVCPTHVLVRRRHYGPRGRVAAAERIARGEKVSRGMLESLYTCLLCRACLYECPTGIDVAELVRSARAILNSSRPQRLALLPKSRA
jgi:Fe-S oxidoreductase